MTGDEVEAELDFQADELFSDSAMLHKPAETLEDSEQACSTQDDFDDGLFCDSPGEEGSDNDSVADVLKKLTAMLERALLGHWRLLWEGRRLPLSSVVARSDVLHVLDDEDWVNEAVEQPGEEDFCALWLVRLELKDPSRRDLLEAICRQVVQDFGGDVDCLLPPDAEDGLRLRLVTAGVRLRDTAARVLENLSLHDLALRGRPPGAALGEEALREIRAALHAPPALSFSAQSSASAPDERELRALLASAGPVSSLRLDPQDPHRSQRTGVCAFTTRIGAARALAKLQGAEVASFQLEVKWQS